MQRSKYTLQCGRSTVHLCAAVSSEVMKTCSALVVAAWALAVTVAPVLAQSCCPPGTWCCYNDCLPNGVVAVWCGPDPVSDCSSDPLCRIGTGGGDEDDEDDNDDDDDDVSDELEIEDPEVCNHQHRGTRQLLYCVLHCSRCSLAPSFW